MRNLLLLIIMCGALPASGVAPWLNDSVDNLINTGLSTHTFPGCQVYIAKGDSVLVDKPYGHTDYTSGIPVTPNTLYDLASVTKAAGTLPGIMAAYDRGLLHLDDTLSSFIPQLRGTPKSGITLRQLLHHESGMPSWLSAVKRMTTASYDSVERKIYDIPLRRDTGYCYSCLNFCLLMDIEQRVTGEPHQQWVARNIFAPLGMDHTCYRPLQRFAPSEIAPTELDTTFRHKLMHGEVHDEIAYMSEGVQGNAGLFSTAGDLARLCRMWLNGGALGGTRVLSESTVKMFTTDKSPTCRRGLGFDKPDTTNPDSSPTTPRASVSTYGHLGFTGTCFWVDPDHDIIFIFLCNRVNPTRDNPAFASLDIRPRLFDLVYRAIKDGQ